ncbi:ABC transporter [Actibacterium mucosum KCTC 23349]|uniref:ABC transporter n=2 Tax=Actibacterium TaxID=1433986 RepID=A0A037ZN64_9RHOB|nr:ABC transporter substrate-binding protein [Actibacterium mucosum]KAJ56968.1 ABC transporter [Actibacterium mucosum KCTC 23349]
MQNNITRRSALAGLVAATGVAGFAAPAFALNTAQAERLINGMITEINRIINSGRSERQMIAQFEAVFTKYSDVPIIARSALGVTARSASSAQMSAFTDAFSGYLSRKYGKRFREFVGGRLEVKSARPVKTFFEVKTTAFLQGESPFEVIFLVSDKSGRNLFFNMYIEGVNMLASERAEIGAMLDRRGGNLDRLIADLKKAG